jgi:hypothetical protein
MPCCVLRVDGAEFDPDAFLATGELVADTTYRRGECRRGGSINSTSGFTVLVSEADHEGQVRAAAQFLQAHREVLTLLRERQEVVMVLDFGGEFPLQAIAARSFRLPLALVEMCASLGVEIELSVYATR